jgi:hypothetical protein
MLVYDSVRYERNLPRVLPLSYTLARRLCEFGMIGLVWSFVTCLLAFLLAGAGNGWLSPLSVCWVSIILSPLAEMSLWLREKQFAKGLLSCICFVFALCDIVILMLSISGADERDRFSRLWSLHPWPIVLWVCLWLGGQVLMFASFLIWPDEKRIYKDLQ